MQRAALALANGRRPPEAEIARNVLGIAFPTGRMQDILWKVFPQGCLGWSKDDRERNLALIPKAVLESHDADSQIDFLRAGGAFWLKEDEALFLSFIAQCEPAALCEIAVFNHRNAQFDPGSFTRLKLSHPVIDAMVDRAAKMVRKADGAPNMEVISALAKLAERLGFGDPIGLSPKYFEAVSPFLESCFRADASDGEIEVGGELVKAIVSRCWTRPSNRYASVANVRWSELPDVVRRACARFLGYANHPRHGSRVVEALAFCYRQLRTTEAAPLEPEMADAMEKARAGILDAGNPADQTQLILALSDRSRGAESDPWRVILQERLIAGSVPPDLHEKAYVLLQENSKLFTAAFREFLLERLTDPAGDVSHHTLDLLTGCPDQYDRLFSIVADRIAKYESLGLHNLMTSLESGLAGTPNAPWADAAGALAFAVATSESARDCVSRAREPAMKLYVRVVGRDAAEDLEPMILDAKLMPEIRAAAASQLIAASPGTKLLPALAKDYDALPLEVRKAIGKAIVDAAAVEGAPDFIARFFRDDDLLWERDTKSAIGQVKVPLTPGLRAALEALADDPEYGEPARQTIARCTACARENEMKLQVKKWGERAAVEIELMVQDEKLDAATRAAAASQLIAASPGTRLLPALVNVYDALPVEVRKALGIAVAEAQQAEGASGLMACFFRDKAMRGQQELTAALKRLSVPLTPGLRDALHGLAGEYEYNDAVYRALRRAQ